MDIKFAIRKINSSSDIYEFPYKLVELYDVLPKIIHKLTGKSKSIICNLCIKNNDNKMFIILMKMVEYEFKLKKFDKKNYLIYYIMDNCAKYDNISKFSEVLNCALKYNIDIYYVSILKLYTSVSFRSVNIIKYIINRINLDNITETNYRKIILNCIEYMDNIDDIQFIKKLYSIKKIKFKKDDIFHAMKWKNINVIKYFINEYNIVNFDIDDVKILDKIMIKAIKCGWYEIFAILNHTNIYEICIDIYSYIFKCIKYDREIILQLIFKNNKLSEFAKDQCKMECKKYKRNNIIKLINNY